MLIQELPFQRNACTARSKYLYFNVHPEESISGSTPTILLQPWGTHRQTPTGLTGDREFLCCSQEEQMRSCLSSIHPD